MSEQLGEAVLVLRTDDSQLDRGIGSAEGKARQLSGTFDQTSASTGRLSQSMVGASKSTGQLEQAMVRTRARGREMVVSAGAQRAGLQQLGYQIGDVATMWSLGARPATIFATQIGQITQAVQLASGGTSRFAAFLGGPWGIAISVAVMALGPFVGKLWEADEAAGMAEAGANALASAQTALGDVFDLVSGKLKTQNELLILNARLKALNLRDEAQTKRAGARDTLVDAQRASAPGFFEAQTIGIPGLEPRRGETNAAALTQLLRDIGSGKITREQALKQSAEMDFTGVKTTRQAFQQALIDTAVANLNDRVADLIDDSLDSGELADGLRKEGREKKPRKGKKGPKDRTAEIAAQHAGEIARLEQEELRAKLELTTDAYERADIQQDLLALERAERIRAIEADKDLTQAQKAAQVAMVERLYGKEHAGTTTDGAILVQANDSPLSQRILRELRERETALATDALQRQIVALDAQAAITTNLKARDAIERKALHLHQRIETNLLEQDIANGRVADADAARALLAEKQAADRAVQLRGQTGPMDRFRDEMRATAENIDEEIEAVHVSGLEHLNDGLTDAIMGARSLGEVFHNVAGSIIADLLRIAIQQQLIKPLADMLFGGGGGAGGGLFGSILTGVFGGARASGGPVDAGKAYLIGERGPELWVPPGAGDVVPNHQLGRGRGGEAPYFDLRGAVMTEDLLRQMDAIAQAHSNSAVATYDRGVGERVQDHAARRG